MHAWWIAIAVGVGCGTPPAPAPVTRPDPMAAPQLDAGPDGPAPAPEGYVDQPGKVPERRALAIGSSTFKKVAGKPRRLTAATHQLIAALPALPRRVVVGTEGDVGLLDPTTGRLTKLTGRFVDVGKRKAVLAITVGERDIHRLFDLDSGRVTEPKITTPDGTAIDWMMTALEDVDVVWLVAKTASGKVFHGQWVDPTRAAVTLAAELPYWPDYIHGDRDLVRTGDSPACTGLHIIGPGAPRCEPENHEDTYLGDQRWIANGELVDATKPLVRLMAGCPPLWVRVLAIEKQAMLTTCMVEGNRRPFELTSPTQRWRWFEDIDGSEPAVHAGPIVALDAIDADRSSRATLTTRWLDLEHGVVLTTPPLIPMASSGRHVLATSAAEPAELFHLDFERGELVKIGPADCYEYRTVDMDGTRVLLDCPTVNGAAEAASTDDTIAEVIDLAARTRTVAKGVIGGRLLPRGAILVSNFWDEEWYREAKRARPPGKDAWADIPVARTRWNGLLLLP